MKPETNQMLEKAQRTLEAARRDMRAGDTGNTISRAYYAAFHAATAALEEAGLTAQSHKGIRHLFHREFVKSGKIDSQHNQAFSRLFQNRQEADYTYGKVFSPQDATDAIRQAETFVEAVAALLST